MTTSPVQSGIRVPSFTQENLSLGFGALLAFFVLSSKHILIYNEETLVVLCFFGFLIFSVRMFGDSFTNSLNERSAFIAQELRASLRAKENLLRELMGEYEKQLGFQTFFQGLNEFSHAELHALSAQRNAALHSLFSHQIQQKLKSLVLTQNALQEKLQTNFQKGFRGSVLEEFQFSKKTLKSKLIQQSLQDLKLS